VLTALWRIRENTSFLPSLAAQPIFLILWDGVKMARETLNNGGDRDFGKCHTKCDKCVRRFAFEALGKAP
jgi:hypothetical protein